VVKKRKANLPSLFFHRIVFKFKRKKNLRPRIKLTYKVILIFLKKAKEIMLYRKKKVSTF